MAPSLAFSTLLAAFDEVLSKKTKFFVKNPKETVAPSPPARQRPFERQNPSLEGDRLKPDTRPS